MIRHPSGCYGGGQLSGHARVSDDQMEARLDWLCSEELQHYRETTKDWVIVMIRELEEAMDAYPDEEMDQNKVNRIYRFGGIVVRETYEWIDELDEAYSLMRAREIRILDGVRTTVDPFTGADSRCVYEFLKQTKPLMNLTEREAVGLFKEELLSPQPERLVPQTTASL